MQNMIKTMNSKVDSIHHTAHTSSNSQMVARNSKKCCKRRHRNQCNFSEICVPVDNHHNANNLIKPCCVMLTKLNLSPHNGNKSSNCLAFPEKNNSSESVTSKEVDKLEHNYSMTENKDMNSSERNEDSVQKRMNLLFERLCETFRLLKAKKKKNKLAKKIKNNVSFSYSAVKQNPSTALIDNLFQGKNQITKTSIPYFASKNKTKGNKKSENAFNNKNKIKILKKFAAQKNLKGEAKNHSAGKELFNENPVCIQDLNIKSSGKDDIPLVENTGSQILKHTVKRNLNEATKKYPDNRSVLALKKKLHGRENIKCLEDAYSIGTKEYNNISTVTRDESNNNVSQMEIVSEQETEFCISSADHSISSTEIDKISNRSTTSKFTTSDGKAFKYLGKTLLIRPCSVVIDKLPVECHENTSCSVVRNGSCNLEAKYVSQCGKSFCTASDSTNSSTKVDEIPNTNDNDTVEVDEMSVKDDDYSVIDGISDIDDDISTSDEIPDVDEDISEFDEIPDIDDDIPFNHDFPNLDNNPVFNRCMFVNVPVDESEDVPNLETTNRDSPALTCFILVADFKYKLSEEEYEKYFIPLRRKKEEKLKRKKMLKKIKKKRHLLERNEFVKEWLLKNEGTAKEYEKDLQMNEI